MNKKDFWTLMIVNIPLVALIIEYCCGLELAFEFLIGWTFVSLITFICVVAKYAKVTVVEEDYEEK